MSAKLPANTTSIYQPEDKAIFRNLKPYIRRPIRTILLKFNNADTPENRRILFQTVTPVLRNIRQTEDGQYKCLAAFEVESTNTRYESAFNDCVKIRESTSTGENTIVHQRHTFFSLAHTLYNICIARFDPMGPYVLGRDLDAPKIKYILESRLVDMFEDLQPEIYKQLVDAAFERNINKFVNRFFRIIQFLRTNHRGEHLGDEIYRRINDSLGQHIFEAPFDATKIEQIRRFFNYCGNKVEEQRIEEFVKKIEEWAIYPDEFDVVFIIYHTNASDYIRFIEASDDLLLDRESSYIPPTRLPTQGASGGRKRKTIKNKNNNKKYKRKSRTR